MAEVENQGYQKYRELVAFLEANPNSTLKAALETHGLTSAQFYYYKSRAKGKTTTRAKKTSKKAIKATTKRGTANKQIPTKREQAPVMQTINYPTVSGKNMVAFVGDPQQIAEILEILF